jgi:general secretion pathway protein N
MRLSLEDAKDLRANERVVLRHDGSPGRATRHRVAGVSARNQGVPTSRGGCFISGVGDSPKARTDDVRIGVIRIMVGRKQLALCPKSRAAIVAGVIILSQFSAAAENSGNGGAPLQANASSPAYSADPGSGVRAKETDGGAGPVSPPGNPLWAIPLASLTATVERPIFSPSRRRPPEKVPADNLLLDEIASLPPAADEPPGPPLVLLGAIANERKSIAIFRDQMTKNIVRLKLGDTHSGWTLGKVNRREAIFNKGHETSLLLIEVP